MFEMTAAPPGEVFAQRWDDQKEELVGTVVKGKAAEVDVEYDALLANRRTLDDPEVIAVDLAERSCFDSLRPHHPQTSIWIRAS